MAFIPKGIIPPVVTPFTEEGTVDFPVYRRVVSHLVEQGIHGMFPLGTTGEFYAVADDEYEALMRCTVEETAGRVPVYAGANHITPKGVIRLIRLAEKAKVDAVSVLTPYFISQSQEELVRYYTEIAEATDLPIIIYNNTPKTNVLVQPETIARLAEIPNIVAAKDSSTNFSNTLEYIRLTRHREDFHVLLGTDTHIYAGLCCGATGAIASGANSAPRLLANIYDRFAAGDLPGALEAQHRFAPMAAANSLGTFPAAIKEGMVAQGFPVGKCADPIAELTEAEKTKLRQVMKETGLL